jgi:hypothetical protein
MVGSTGYGTQGGPTHDVWRAIRTYVRFLHSAGTDQRFFGGRSVPVTWGLDRE